MLNLFQHLNLVLFLKAVKILKQVQDDGFFLCVFFQHSIIVFFFDLSSENFSPTEEYQCFMK